MWDMENEMDTHIHPSTYAAFLDWLGTRKKTATEVIDNMENWKQNCR